jgi:hypothetical protein
MAGRQAKQRNTTSYESAGRKIDRTAGEQMCMQTSSGMPITGSALQTVIESQINTLSNELGM